jgi:hypothetical protein
MGRGVFASLGGGLVAAACTLTTSLDGFTTPGVPGSSADSGGPGQVTGPGDGGTSPTENGDDAGDASASASRYRALVMSDGPVGYWRLGDTGASAKDETGAHPGTVIGTISHGPGAIAGDPDDALVGNGSGWIDIAQIYPFTGNAPYSIEAWVAPQPSSTLTGVLSRNVATPGNPPTDGYSLYIDVPSLTPTMGRWKANAEQAAAGPGLPTGIFSYVVGTYDGATLRVYVDGVLKASAAAGQAIIAPAADLSIASTRNGTYAYFIGALDEVALYDKALAPDRIAAHHAAGLGL